MVPSPPPNVTPASAPRLRPGDFAQIEVPWTVELPAPHRAGTLIDHFALEQCSILCETIEQSRQAQERRTCRLVDLEGTSWFVDIFPDRSDRGARLVWFRKA
jgi:hypothetical protein